MKLTFSACTQVAGKRPSAFFATSRLATTALALAAMLAHASPVMAADVAMTEFYNARLNYYFVAPKEDHKAALDTVPGCARTGKSYIVSDTAENGGVQLSRFYFDKVARGQSRGSHFYTALDTDRAALRALNPGNTQAARSPFDEGTNGTSCVLTAPSARSLSSANISPLTTLLQTYMEQSGGGVADAEKWFKVQTGINSSPLDDYSTTLRNRAAFAAGNKVNYLSCYERRSDATSLNCALIGSGTYKIEALGDARAMSFQNQPTATLAGGLRTGDD